MHPHDSTASPPRNKLPPFGFLNEVVCQRSDPLIPFQPQSHPSQKQAHPRSPHLAWVEDVPPPPHRPPARCRVRASLEAHRLGPSVHGPLHEELRLSVGVGGQRLTAGGGPPVLPEGEPRIRGVGGEEGVGREHLEVLVRFEEERPLRGHDRAKHTVLKGEVLGRGRGGKEGREEQEAEESTS